MEKQKVLRELTNRELRLKFLTARTSVKRDFLKKFNCKHFSSLLSQCKSQEHEQQCPRHRRVCCLVCNDLHCQQVCPFVLQKLQEYFGTKILLTIKKEKQWIKYETKIEGDSHED